MFFYNNYHEEVWTRKVHQAWLPCVCKPAQQCFVGGTTQLRSPRGNP